MRYEIRVPKLGLTMTEGTLVEWCVQPGEAFTAGQTLFVIESEKAANEIEADADGVLVEVLAEAGVTLPCGEVIGYWEGEAGVADSSRATTAASATSDTPGTSDTPATSSSPAGSATAEPQPETRVSTPRGSAGRVIATPLARRMARNHGLDLGTVSGSGPRGRIRAADVEQAIQAAPRPAETIGTTPKARDEDILRSPTALERTVAERLVAAKQQIPHFYLSVEADVTALTGLRKELNAAQENRRLTLNHFIVAAVGRALVQMPEVNAVWTADGILQFGNADVGMAVNTEKGLYVPVLRDVGRLSLAQIARCADELAGQARDGRLSGPDMTGGAITVSNAGMYDVTYMASIINPGQSMILGVGSVRDVFRPDQDGQPVLRREMGMVLSADHRVLDGARALQFLKRVVQGLEQPLGLMVEA